jgi:hypothetical protein
MVEQIEISSIDLRYETFRLKSKSLERSLLSSVIEHGIREPLKGVDSMEGTRVLLDGFKRYRCASKLNIGIVPYESYGSDEPSGIIRLIHLSTQKNLSILEQAKMIDELRSVHGMSLADIADFVQKSKAWVSQRSGILSLMSDTVVKRIFDGDFPVYSFMYTLRKFIRITGKKDMDDFVNAVAGKALSIRDIDVLATGYFKGTDDFRQQIIQGNIHWGLKRLKESATQTPACTGSEQSMLRDLESLQGLMQRVMYRAQDTGLSSDAFHVQATLLAQSLIKLLDSFGTAVRGFYDRCKQA